MYRAADFVETYLILNKCMQVIGSMGNIDIRNPQYFTLN